MLSEMSCTDIYPCTLRLTGIRTTTTTTISRRREAGVSLLEAFQPQLYDYHSRKAMESVYSHSLPLTHSLSLFLPSLSFNM